MAATENSKSLHVLHTPHIVLSTEATGAYHHNFGLHVYICMLFCVLMTSYTTNHTILISHFHPYTMIRKDWEWCQTLSPYITDMVRFSRNMLQQCILSGRYIFEGPYAHENRHCLRTLTVVWEHVQLCHMNLHIAAVTSVYIYVDRQSDNALVTCGTIFKHFHADFFTLPWKLEVVSQPVQGVLHCASQPVQWRPFNKFLMAPITITMWYVLTFCMICYIAGHQYTKCHANIHMQTKDIAILSFRWQPFRFL